MGFFIDKYHGFRGNVLELADLAAKCSQYLNLPGDVEKVNERTLRYYVSEGLVEKPKRIGRDAEYEYIHLLQFLASRYLVSEGYPMAKVAPYISVKGQQELEEFLTNPTKPNLAELLVASFSKDKQVGRDPTYRNSPSARYSIDKLDDLNQIKNFESRLQRSTSRFEDDRCHEEIKKIQREMRDMRVDLISAIKDLRDKHEEDRERWQTRIDELINLVKMQNK